MLARKLSLERGERGVQHSTKRQRHDRDKALMFVYFIAMLIAALAERSIRLAMADKGIKVIHTLPGSYCSGSCSRRDVGRRVISLGSQTHGEEFKNGCRFIR